MTVWNKISFGFDTEEETANFGTRAVVENNGSVYSTSTLALIQPDKEETENSSVSASYQHSKLCVVINNCIIIFTDVTCKTTYLCIQFDSEILCHTLNEDGTLLFTVSKAGILSCRHLPFKGKEIYSTNIGKAAHIDATLIKILLQKQDNGLSYNIILVGKNGGLYRICNFPVELQNSVVKEHNNSSSIEVPQSIQCTPIFKGFKKDEATCIMSDLNLGKLTVVVMGVNNALKWCTEEQTTLVTIPQRYVKAEFLKHYQSMLCLRADHALCIVCPHTFLGLKIYDDPIIDFIISNSDNNEQYEAVVLLQARENNEEQILRVISLPDLNQKFQINVSNMTYLIEAPAIVNNVIFLEVAYNNAKAISTIRVKSIIECVPEHHLERLLRKKKFEEAEMFANKFSLPTELIYCAKAKVLVDQLTLDTNENNDVVNISSLINIFDKIKNVEYIFNCCKNIVILDFKQMRMLFLYVQGRIMNNVEEIKNIHLGLLSSMNDKLHKWKTFEMIWTVLLFESKNEEKQKLHKTQIIKQWISFSNTNLLKECKTYLTMGHFELAALIWTRHMSEIIKVVSLENVQEIFAAIPEDASPLSLWPCLSHIVPSLLTFIPDTMEDIVSWGYRKIKSFESTHYSSWPQIGINFANRFINLLKINENSLSSCIYKGSLNESLGLKRFMDLIQTLVNLQKLKTDHRITMSLTVYTGDPLEVTHLLLDKVHIERMNNLMDKFLKQYMLDHSLQNDTVCSLYVQKVLRNCTGWYCWEEAPWDHRIVTVINFIHNIEIRLQKILDVLKKAPVPWSEVIIQLADTNSVYEHHLSFQIRIERDYVPIKLILKKYGYEKIGTNHKLLLLIIKESRTDMINDILVLTKRDHKLKQYAFFSYINYHLCKSNFNNVIEVFNNLDEDIILYCCERIVNSVKAKLNLKNTPDDSLSSNVEFLSYATHKLEEILNRSTCQIYHYQSIIFDIKDVKTRYYLRNQFCIIVTDTAYYTGKSQILRNYIKDLCIGTKKTSPFIAYRNAIAVADALTLTRLSAISMFLQYSDDLDILKQYFVRTDAFQYVDILMQECPYVNDICLSILQSTKIDGQTDVDINILENLCTAALSICTNDKLKCTLLLYSLISMYQESFGKYCKQFTDIQTVPLRHHKWQLYAIYKDLIMPPKHILIPLLKNTILISIYSNYMNLATPHLVNVNHTSDNQESLCVPTVQAKKVLTDLVEKIRNTKAEHNEYIYLKIINTVYIIYGCSFNEDKIFLNQIKSLLLECVTTLLKKVISVQTLDLQMGLICLFMLPTGDACKWITSTCKMFQNDYSRHSTIVMLGYEYFRLTKNYALMQSFNGYKVLHYWALTLSKYSIDYKEMFTNDALDKRKILERLMTCKQNNVISLLEDFCISFGFNVNDCFMLYLQLLIKTWNPTIQPSTTAGKSELCISPAEIKNLRRKCNNVVAKITNKIALKDCIRNILCTVNVYYYEIFIILLDLLEEKCLEKREYMYFLQNYTRTGCPSQIEQELWAELSPEDTSLPIIAKYRLPFVPKVDTWKLIAPELNLKTYEKWLQIAPVLKLQPNVVCTLAIKGEIDQIREKLFSTEKNNVWRLQQKNAMFLVEVKKCIEQMTDPDALYYGTSVLYYIVNHTPAGADQVAAISECYKYAQLSLQKSQIVKTSVKFDKNMFETIKFKYLRYTAEHILRMYDVGKSNYITLIANPEKLVSELYKDESIHLRYLNVVIYKPDINSAVREICELFSLNLIKLRLELLEECLQPTRKYNEVNQSITDNSPMLRTSCHSDTDKDNLYRACYMLEDGDVTLSANFLINIAFGDNTNSNYSPEVRYRALYILQCITDSSTLQDLTKRKLLTIRNYMKSLKYLAALDSFGINYSVDTFNACSKYELAQILLKAQYYNPQALTLIAQICIDFQIHDLALWDKNLKRMVNLGMVHELQSILREIQGISLIINCDGYTAGWQLVFTEPFKKMEMPITTVQINDCIKSLCFLYSCPVTHKLTFTNAIEYCFQCGQHYLAAALLPFLNCTERDYVLKVIKSVNEVSKITTDLKSLLDYGIFTIRHSIDMIEESLLEDN